MSITKHKYWWWLKRHIVIQYARDGTANKARVRIELSNKASQKVQNTALAITIPCPACGEEIHPFRSRGEAKRGNIAQNIYYGSSCPLKVNVACSRSHAASDEYETIRRALGK